MEHHIISVPEYLRFNGTQNSSRKRILQSACTILPCRRQDHPNDPGAAACQKSCTHAWNIIRLFHDLLNQINGTLRYLFCISMNNI